MAAKKTNEIVKANAPVEASYRLSVSEQRIILACIAQVRRDQPLTDELMYTVTATQYAEFVGTGSNNAYQELEKAAIRLKRREVYLGDEPNGKGRKRKVMVTNWVQTIVYHADEGRVELRFNKDMVPYLSQLTVQFTRYALSDVARMTSSHAIRLYELMAQWQNQGIWEISLSWLQECLGLKGQYPAFQDFKRRVIRPAVKQINTLSPLKAAWQPIKTGRKITALRFEFKCKATSSAAALSWFVL